MTVPMNLNSMGAAGLDSTMAQQIASSSSGEHHGIEPNHGTSASNAALISSMANV